MDLALRFLSLRDPDDTALPLRQRVVLNQLPLSITAALLLFGVAVVHPEQLADARVHWAGGLLLALLVLCAVVPWERLDERWVLAVPLLDFLPVGLLREGLYPEVSGTAILPVFPVLWLVSSGLLRHGAASLGAVMTLGVVWVPVLVSAAPVTPTALTSPLLVPFIMLIIGATVQEITHRLRQQSSQLRAALATAAQRERLLHTVLDAVNSKVLALDTAGRPLLTNHGPLADYAWQRAVHGPAAEASLPGIYTASGAPMASADRPIARAAAGESFTDYLVRYGDAPDQRVLSVAACTIHDDRRQPEGSVLSFTDVTDLVSALNAKDDFIAGVSHELRTPLTSIRGYTELLAMDPTVPAHVQTGLETIERNTGQLMHLVEGLLNTHRTHTLVRKTPADLTQLLAESTAAAQPQAEQTGITVKTWAADTLPVHCDPQKIGQVLDNLISNAIKYSPPHSAVFVLGAHSPDAVQVQVIDHGTGMSPEDTTQIFQQFYRSPTARMSTVPGLGLGLAVSKDIVDAHGGTLTCHSALGEGTIFTLTLPTTDRPASQAAASTTVPADVTR